MERELANARRASVVAPAGCGKTELIARSVAVAAGRQLVLTHTHAGVDALRRRLAKYGAAKNAHVATIAGWSLRQAAAYPELSGLGITEPEGDQWKEVYAAAARLFATSGALREVLAASYAGVYVDEYQDCTELHHALILALAEVLPVRVLGDPLQGIFDFAGEALPPWADVLAAFPLAGTLTEPHRWRGKHEALGEWLVAARKPLLRGERVSFQDAPVERHAAEDAKRRNVCWAVRGGDETAVAIRKWPSDCHRFAESLRGAFTSIEEMECKELVLTARALDGKRGSARALELLEFAQRCIVGSAAHVGGILAALRAGRGLGRIRKHRDVVELVERIAGGSDPGPAEVALLDAVRRLPKVRAHRRELFLEMRRTLDQFARGGYETLADAARGVRAKRRHIGRDPEPRVVARTLLVKGLEFDAAIVLEPGELDAKNLYVAMTRGARRLIVFDGV